MFLKGCSIWLSQLQNGSGKRKIVSFSTHDKIATACFDLIHTGAWNAPIISRSHHEYFVTFIDD